MSVAIKYNGAFTDRTGMRQLVAAAVPVAGTLRDYAAQDLASSGTLTQWPERNGGLPLTLAGGPTVQQEGTRRFLRFNGSGQWGKEDTVDRTQPHTLFIRYRLQGAAIANRVIAGSALASGINFALNTTPSNVMLFAGVALSPTVSVLDTNWHTAVLTVNGTSSAVHIDGIDKTGSAGTQNGTGLRLATGSGTPSSYTAVDIARVGLLARAADAAERAAIAAALNA